MFGSDTTTGLVAGEIRDNDWFEAGFDDVVYRLTVDCLDGDWPDDRDRHRLPAGFDLIPPGPLLGAALAKVDRRRLNGFDLVRTMQAHERLVSHHQAQSMADAVEISYAAPGNARSPAERLEEAFEFASDEIRAALTLTRRAAEGRLSDASELRERLPRVWGMLHEGLIDLARARVILKGTTHLSEETARRLVDEIAGRAPGLTTGQLAALIRRLCVEVDPDEAKQRYERAVEARRLWIEQTVDGTANLHLLDIAIEDAKAIGRRINAHMINVKKANDSRSHDQIRADITSDMLLGSDPTNHGKGLVDVRVDLTTLAALDNKAAEIPGMGPIIADIARQVAFNQEEAEWRWTVTDPDRGIFHTGILRRRPNTAQLRQIYARDLTCTFPGCRMPATDCDIDHEIPWAEGGPTSVRHNTPRCRYDHILKDHGWKHRFLNGEHIHTSPLGHTYVTNGRSP